MAISSPIPPAQGLDALIDRIQASLKAARRWGCRGFKCDPDHLDRIDAWSRPPGVVADGLPAIRADLGDCQRCDLCRQRTTIVFGEGAPDARLVFVGEGPGSEEDRQGRPFVGPAGQLLTRIIQAMHLTRKEVYICNVVKCRPPNNRAPESSEMATCLPFLERQLAVIRPEVICTLGAVATSALLGRDVPISRVRGRFQDYNGIKLMPTFHPSYLLRTPERKRDVWEDMKKIMALLDIPL